MSSSVLLMAVLGVGLAVVEVMRATQEWRTQSGKDYW